MKLPRELVIPPPAREIPLNKEWGAYAKLSISREEMGGFGEPTYIAATFLFVPDEREELHYHIELTKEGVEELWVWLHEHMHAEAEAAITTEGNNDDTQV